MLTAITRAVSPALPSCELSYIGRQPIDLEKARLQHRAYEKLLEELGARVISLPAEPTLPVSRFVEVPAIVLDVVAVIMPLGTASRRPMLMFTRTSLETRQPARSAVRRPGRGAAFPIPGMPQVIGG